MKTTALCAAAVVLLTAGCATRTPDDRMPDVMDNDPMIVQLSSMARTAFDDGNIPRATIMYRRALERARAMDNSREIGWNAYNLAVCRASAEEWDEAVRLLRESERETLLAGDDAGPVVLLLADIQQRRGDWREAMNTINRLETLPVSDHIRGQAYVLRAEIACSRGAAAEAEAFLARAAGFLRRDMDNGLAGEIARVSGRIAVLKEDWPEAAALFDREAAWMKRAGRLAEMALALEQAGVQHLRAGDEAAAADRFYRAARSLMAQEYYLDALAVIEQAVALQHGGGNPGGEVAALFEEIQASVDTMSRAPGDSVE